MFMHATSPLDAGYLGNQRMYTRIYHWQWWAIVQQVTLYSETPGYSQ
jgi:hypothetical protein